MRIIAGRYRRRRLRSLEGAATRPMLDRMRETLFNILQGRIEGKAFADLYAGTGAVGIEALSRGARPVVFVEKSPAAVKVIEQNLRDLAVGDEARVRPIDVAKALLTLQADVCFLGPPYDAAQEYERTLAALGERAGELVIAQHAARSGLREQYGRLRRTRVVRMGANALSFFEPA